MTAKNVYETCPVYETETFLLRLVKREDAAELLSCYSDKKAVEKCNTDCCTSDFHYTSLEQMEECIDFWLKEYEAKAYVRFAVVPKEVGKPKGTVEVFGGSFGVLRIDLAASYDKACYIEELLRLAVLHFIRDFKIKSLKVKAGNTPERIPLLEKYGFVLAKSFRPQSSYYERPERTYFDEEKGMAYCGLACCVCSENISCAGCKSNGKASPEKDEGDGMGSVSGEKRCSSRESCQNYSCCREKGLLGCWQCSSYPCGNPMLQKPRVRAFLNFIAKHGEKTLLMALKNNEEHGVLYHYEGQLVGDYDLARKEEETDQMLCMGAEIEGIGK